MSYVFITSYLVNTTVYFFQMDRSRLLPMDLPTITINGSSTVKGKASFVRRLAIGFVILAILGLLYVPAYHSAQSPFSNLGETPSPPESLSSLRSVASVGMFSLIISACYFICNNLIWTIIYVLLELTSGFKTRIT